MVEYIKSLQEKVNLGCYSHKCVWYMTENISWKMSAKNHFFLKDILWKTISVFGWKMEEWKYLSPKTLTKSL